MQARGLAFISIFKESIIARKVTISSLGQAPPRYPSEKKSILLVRPLNARQPSAGKPGDALELPVGSKVTIHPRRSAQDSRGVECLKIELLDLLGRNRTHVRIAMNEDGSAGTGRRRDQRIHERET